MGKPISHGFYIDIPEPCAVNSPFRRSPRLVPVGREMDISCLDGIIGITSVNVDKRENNCSDSTSVKPKGYAGQLYSGRHVPPFPRWIKEKPPPRKEKQVHRDIDGRIRKKYHVPV